MAVLTANAWKNQLHHAEPFTSRIYSIDTDRIVQTANRNEISATIECHCSPRAPFLAEIIHLRVIILPSYCVLRVYPGERHPDGTSNHARADRFDGRRQPPSRFTIRRASDAVVDTLIHAEQARV